MENSRHNNPHLGVNKLGKNIRKSPLHQPSTYHQHHHQPPAQPHPPPPPPPPQPQVYNISKNDFRSIVQQLTGTPSRDPIPNNNIPPPQPQYQVGPPRPPPPHPKPSSMRLQKIRPPPLTPIARPPLNPNPNPNPNPSPAGFLPRPGWADSPVSAYMRYLETSLLHSDGVRQYPPHPAAAPFPAFPSPRSNPNPNYPNHHHHPGPIPSPGSQFMPPSPSSFLNLLSPRSPYPLLSPGFQYPPPLTPNFSFSPMAGQSGLLGPGPLSPGLMFPSSPSGFFNLMSPRWRDM